MADHDQVGHIQALLGVGAVDPHVPRFVVGEATFVAPGQHDDQKRSPPPAAFGRMPQRMPGFPASISKLSATQQMAMNQPQSQAVDCQIVGFVDDRGVQLGFVKWAEPGYRGCPA